MTITEDIESARLGVTYDVDLTSHVGASFEAPQ